MFDSALVPRLLALPADVRGALAGVKGPGWIVHNRGGGGEPYVEVVLQTWFPTGFPSYVSDAWRYAFFPANPAQAVAAVTGWTLSACYAVITVRLQSGFDGDHAAALSIIEAHVASRSPHAS